MLSINARAITLLAASAVFLTPAVVAQGYAENAPQPAPGYQMQPVPNNQYRPQDQQYPNANQYPAPNGYAPRGPGPYGAMNNNSAGLGAVPLQSLQSPQSVPGGMYCEGGPPPGSAAPTIGQWFSRYDQIRHEAQMTPAERQRADGLMSRGLSLLVPGEEKQLTKNLLASLVFRYQRACQQLKALPQMNQTNNLQVSYFQYFYNAAQLFSDYARVQDNVFATDQSTGQPIAAGLMQRKQMLEGLEHQCKALDSQTRMQFKIPSYQW